MDGTIHLEVVTPDGVKLAADVSEFTAPSVDGEHEHLSVQPQRPCASSQTSAFLGLGSARYAAIAEPRNRPPAECGPLQCAHLTRSCHLPPALSIPATVSQRTAYPLSVVPSL